MLNIDTFIKLGDKEHNTCKDYILYGENPIPYIVLADGYVSSKYTDVGARLLCFSVQSFIKDINKGFNLINYNNIIDFISYSLKPVLDILMLDQSSLDVNLMVSFIYDDIVYVYTYGSGCIITISESGEKDMYHKIYKNKEYNYLSYKMLHDKMKYDDESLLKYRESWNNSNPLELNNSNIFKFPLDLYKCVIVSSDSLITSFFDKSGNSINIKDILKELTSFKDISNDFIKIRVKKMIKDFFYEKKGIYHNDNISIGGFHK